MTTLKKIIQDHIHQRGPIDVGTFMNLALGHPEYGYYMKQDPFGADGDFTTAPEISQMFGEIIGVWVADVWIQMGKPAPFTLLECGPGRGTLMADLLRATKNIPGFHAAAQIHLLEMSPVLKQKQRDTLKEYNIQWHETLDTIPGNQPLIVIANEFLDALPIRQFQKTKEGWAEKVVGFEEGKFVFFMQGFLLDLKAQAREGEIVEMSPARSAFMHQVSKLLKKNDGAALFIDYGHAQSALGDTLQALYKHAYVSPLDHIGDADLTAHVDFMALKEEAEKSGMAIHGPAEQGAFLKNLGIDARAAALSSKATEKQREDIKSALHRLTDSSEMGTLFKVMSISHGKAIRPSGF